SLISMIATVWQLLGSRALTSRCRLCPAYVCSSVIWCRLLVGTSTSTKRPLHSATHSKNSTKHISFHFLLASFWASRSEQCRSCFLGCHIQSGSVLQEVR